MSNRSKIDKAVRVGNKSFITVDPTLPSFEGHPFFEEKVKAAKKLLQRVGLPPRIARKPR